MPTDHNDPRAAQCHISGLGLCDLHNIIRTHYGTNNQGLPDEDNNHKQVPGAWRYGGPECYNHSQDAGKVFDVLLQHCWGSSMTE